MQNKESIKKNSIKTIKMYLSLIHTMKNSIPYGLRESRATEHADLKSLYFGQIERDGRNFLPLGPFYILQHFMRKDKNCMKWRVADEEIRSLSPEQLSEEYCSFVAEETKKAIRERIKELDKEIEVEKREAEVERNTKLNKETSQASSNTSGSTSGNTAAPDYSVKNKTPKEVHLSISDGSVPNKTPKEVHFRFGSFKKKRPVKRTEKLAIDLATERLHEPTEGKWTSVESRKRLSEGSGKLSRKKSLLAEYGCGLSKERSGSAEGSGAELQQKKSLLGESSDSILDGAPPKKKRVRFAGAE